MILIEYFYNISLNNETFIDTSFGSCYIIMRIDEIYKVKCEFKRTRSGNFWFNKHEYLSKLLKNNGLKRDYNIKLNYNTIFKKINLSKGL